MQHRHAPLIFLFIFIMTIYAGATVQQEKAAALSKTAEAAPMLTVEQILDKYLQAVGGKEAVEKVTSIVSKGTAHFPSQNASGVYVSYAKAPNKSLLEISIGGFGLVQRAFNGTVGWNSDRRTGVSELSGLDLVARQRDSEFYKESRLKELYPTMTVKTRSKIGEKEAYVLEAMPKNGAAEQLYFDVQTGLLLRRAFERETPGGKVTGEVDYEDYREVDGIKRPFTTRISNPVNPIVIKLDEIKHNVAIDDAKFDKPSDQ